MRACSLIDDEGKWNDPPKRLIVEHRKSSSGESQATEPSASEASAAVPRLSPAPTQPAPPPSAQPSAQAVTSTAENLNGNFHLFENDRSPTKPMTERTANRNSYDKN